MTEFTPIASLAGGALIIHSVVVEDESKKTGGRTFSVAFDGSRLRLIGEF